MHSVKNYRRTMTILKAGAAVALLVVTVPMGAARAGSPSTVTYGFDPAHTSINFAVQHLVINTIRGRFKEFTGSIALDEKDVANSSVEFTAKTASISTDVEPRDNDLRSPNFLDAAKFPELTFKSSKVEKHGKGFICHGTFTLHGVSKEIAIPFTLSGPITDPWGNHRIGVTASISINRQDYGVAYDKKLPDGGLAVGNEVQIDLNIEAVHKMEKPAN